MRDLSLGKHLTLSFVVSSMLFNSALALPSGGSFVGGSHGDIIQNGNVMDITGKTQGGKHIISWGGGFNIDKGETVNFKGNNQFYLNLDYSKNSSKLYGKLNGGDNNIFLVNPNGTIIGNGAVINANKFAVSTKALDDNQMQKFMQTGQFSPVFEPSVAGDITIERGADIKVSDLALVGDKIVFAGGVNAKEGMKIQADQLSAQANAISVDDGANLNSKNINFTASTLISFNGGVINTTNLSAKAGTDQIKGQINLSKNSDINAQGDLTFTSTSNIKGSANIKANSVSLTATDAINLNGGTIEAANQSLSSNWIKLEDTTLTNATNITLAGSGNQSVVELNGATLNLSGTLDIDAYQVELNKKGTKDTTITGANQAKVDIDATNQIAFNGATFNAIDIDLQATNKIDIKDTVLNIAGKTLKMLSKGSNNQGGIINIESTETPNYNASGDITIKNLELEANDINLNQGAKLETNNLNIKANNNAIFTNAALTAYHSATINATKYIGINGGTYTFGRTANPAKFISQNIKFENANFKGTNGKSGIDLKATDAIELTNNKFENLTKLEANAKQITYNSGTIDTSVDNVAFTTTDNQLLIKGGNINATNVTLSADKYLEISGNANFSNKGTTLNLLGKNLIDLSGGTITAGNINIGKVNGYNGNLTLNITNGSFSANNKFSANADKITVGGTDKDKPSITGTNTLTFNAKQIYVKNGQITSKDLDFTAKDNNKGLIEISGGTITGSIKADFISDNYIHLKGGTINGGALKFQADGNHNGTTKGATIDFEGTTITSTNKDTAIKINADQINFNGGTLTATSGIIDADAKHKIVVDGSKFDTTKLDLYAQKEVELKKGFGDGMADNEIDIGTGEGGNIDISLGENETIKGDNLTFTSYYIDLKSGTLEANKNLTLEAYNNFKLSGKATLKAATANLITHNVMTISGGTLETNTLNIIGKRSEHTATGENEGVVITIKGGTLSGVTTLNTSGADELNFDSNANWTAKNMYLNSKHLVFNGGKLTATTNLNIGKTSDGKNSSETKYITVKDGSLTANQALALYATNLITISGGTLTATNALDLYATNLITISGGTLKGASVNLSATTNSNNTGIIDLQGGEITANNGNGTITANASQITTQNGENGNTGTGTEFKVSTLNLNATNNLHIEGGNFNAVTNLNFKGKAGIEFSGGAFGETSNFTLSSDGLVNISRTGELKATKFTINGYNGSGNAGGIKFANAELSVSGDISFSASKQLEILSGSLVSTGGNISLSGLGSLQISGDSTSIKGANVNLNSNNWISITDASLEATSGTLSIQAKAESQANGTGKVIDILGSANLKASNGTIDIDAQEINIGTTGKADSDLSLDAQTIDLSANNRVNINNGTLKATASAKNDKSPDFSIWAGQSINISGNAVLNALNGLLKLNTFNKIDIKGGTLKANQLVLNAKPNNANITKGGIINISGGTLENTGDKFTLTANQINTSGGTFKANSNLDFNAANKIIINGGTFNVKNGTFTLDGKKQIDFKQGTFDFGSNGNLVLTTANDGMLNYTLANELKTKDLTIAAGEINLEKAKISASGKFDFDATEWIRIKSSTLTANGDADITAKAMEFSGGSFKAKTLTLNTGGLLNIKDKASLEATGGTLTINEKQNSGNSELNLDNGSSLKASSDIKIDTDEINIKGALNAQNITLGDTNAQNINITDGANVNATTALVLKALKSILVDGASTQLQGATIDFTNSGYTHIIDGIINAATSIKFTQNGADNLLRIEGGTISTGNASTPKSGSITFAGNEANVQIWGGDFDTGEFKADNVKQFIIGNTTTDKPTIDATSLNLNASNNLAIANGTITATTASLQSANLIDISGGTLTINSGSGTDAGKLIINADKKVNITGGVINAQNINFITKNYIYLGGSANITASGNIDFVANNNGQMTDGDIIDKGEHTKNSGQGITGTVEFAENLKLKANTITIGEKDEKSDQRVEQIIFNMANGDNGKEGGIIETTGENGSIKGYAKQVYVKGGTLKSNDLYLEGREIISLKEGATIDNGGKFIEFVSGNIIELGIALQSSENIRLTAPQINIVGKADIEASKNLTLISTGLTSQAGKGGLFLSGGKLTAGNTLTLVGENGIAMLDNPSALTISGKKVELFSNNYINITGSITGEEITLSGFEKSGDTYISKTGQNTVIELANTDITGTSKDSSTLTIDGAQINLSGSKTISNFNTANFTATNQIALNGGVFKNITTLNLLGTKEVLIAGAMIKEGISALNIKSDNHITLQSGEITTSSLNLSGLSDTTKPKVIDFSGASVSVNNGNLTANAQQINIKGGSVNANNINFTATNIKASGGSLKADTKLTFTTKKGTGENQNGKIDISGTASLEAQTLNLVSENWIAISGGTLKGTTINLGDETNKDKTVIDITGGNLGESTSTVNAKGAQINIGSDTAGPTINGTLNATASNQILIKNGILNLLTASLTAANLVKISGGEIKVNSLTLTATDQSKGKISIAGGTIQANGGEKKLEANAKWIDISGGEITGFNTANFTASDILEIKNGAKFTNNKDTILKATGNANSGIRILGGTFSGAESDSLKLLSDNLIEISGGTFSVKTTINGASTQGDNTNYNSSLTELIIKGGTFDKTLEAHAKDINFANGTVTFNNSGATFRASNYLKFGTATIKSTGTSALSFNATNSILAEGTTFTGDSGKGTMTFQTTANNGYIGLIKDTKVTGFSTVSLNSSKDLELNSATINTATLSLKSTNNTVLDNATLTTSTGLKIEATKDLRATNSTITINGGAESANSIKANNILFDNSKLALSNGAKAKLDATATFKLLNSQLSILGGSGFSANAKDIIIQGVKDNLTAMLGGSSSLSFNASNVLDIKQAKFEHKNSNGNGADGANKFTFQATSKIIANDVTFAKNGGSNSSADIKFTTTDTTKGTIEFTKVSYSNNQAESGQTDGLTLSSNHINFKDGNNLSKTVVKNTNYITIAGTNSFTSATLDAQKLIDIKDGAVLTLSGANLKSANELKATNATINLSGANNFYAQNQRFEKTSFSGANSTLNFKGYNGEANKIEFLTGTKFSNISNINANAKGILVDTGVGAGFLSGINALNLDASSDLQIKENTTVNATNMNLNSAYLYITAALKATEELKLNTEAPANAYLKLDGTNIEAKNLTMGKKDGASGSRIDILNSSTITSSALAKIYADGIYLKGNSQLNFNGGQDGNDIIALSEFVAQSSTIALNGGLTIDGGKEIELSGSTFTKSAGTANLRLSTTKDINKGNNGIIKITDTKFGGDTGQTPLDSITIANNGGAGANDIIIDKSTLNANDITLRSANRIDIKNDSKIAAKNFTVGNAKDLIVDNSSIATSTSANLTLSNLIEFKNGTNISATGIFKANGTAQTTFDNATFTTNGGEGSGIFTKKIKFTNSTFTQNGGTFAFGNGSTQYLKIENNKDNSKGLTLNGGTLTFEGKELDFKNTALKAKGTVNFNSTGDINFDGAIFTVANNDTTTFNIGSRDNATLNIDFKNTAINGNANTTVDIKAKTSENKGGKVSLSGLTVNNEIKDFIANANWIDIANGATIKAKTVNLSTPGKILMTGGTIIADNFYAVSGSGSGNIYLQGGKIQAAEVTLQGNEVQILKREGEVNKSGTTIIGKNGSDLATKLSVGSYNGKNTNHAYILANTVYASTIENNGGNQSWTSMDIDALIGNSGGWGNSDGPTMSGSARTYLNIATKGNNAQQQKENADQWYKFVEWFNQGVDTNKGIASYDEYVLLNDIDFSWANLAKNNGLGTNTYGLIKKFTGQTLNGNGKALKNFNIGNEELKFSGAGTGNAYAGLILEAGEGSVFKNVKIEGAWMNLNGSSIQYAGVLVGRADRGAVFDNIKFNTDIGITADLSRNSTVYIGGIVGLTTNGSKFTNIDIGKVQVNLTQNANQPLYAGGVVGQIQGGSEIHHIYIGEAEVRATSKSNQNRAYAGGFAGTMRGNVNIHDIAMNNIKVYAQGNTWSIASGLTSKEYTGSTSNEDELALWLTIKDIYLYTHTSNVNGSSNQGNRAINSYFVGAYSNEDKLTINGIRGNCNSNNGQCKPSSNANINIYVGGAFNSYDQDGIDGKFMSTGGYPNRVAKVYAYTNNNPSQWTDAVQGKYNSIGFYKDIKIDIAIPNGVTNITDQSNNATWSETSGVGGKGDIANLPSGEEKNTSYTPENSSAASNDDSVTDITGDIIVSDNGDYTSDSTDIGSIGGDSEGDAIEAKPSGDITADGVTDIKGSKPGNLIDDLTDIVDSGSDNVASITPPSTSDITGDSDDTITGTNDSEATADSDINYDEDLANKKKADIGDESGFTNNNNQPGDIDGNENGNGNGGGGDGGNNDNGVDNLNPNNPSTINDSGKGSEIKINVPSKVTDNAGSLIDKNFSNITYTDKKYTFSSDDYSADILEEILGKITDGYYTLDVSDLLAAYEAAQKGDIAGLLKILQVKEANFESIRQAMDFMMAFYSKKEGQEGLGNTIKASGGDKFKAYNEKATKLEVDKGALWDFIYGAGKFDDAVGQFFKDYDKYVDYKEKLNDLNSKYNALKQLMDSGKFGEEGSSAYENAKKELDKFQEQYNTLKDEADKFIAQTMKPQSDYLVGVFNKTDKDSNGHFKFADNSGKIGDDFDYTKGFTDPEVPEIPDKQPEVPEPPKIDPKMFSDVTDHAQVLEDEEDESNIDEAAGEERQRLCVVSDNAKAMNECLAPK